jgi:hypothetical protein
MPASVGLRAVRPWNRAGVVAPVKPAVACAGKPREGLGTCCYRGRRRCLGCRRTFCRRHGETTREHPDAGRNCVRIELRRASPRDLAPTSIDHYRFEDVL